MPNPFSSTTFTHLSIGAVFTPTEWAGFAIEEFDLFHKWMAGKTIFDPTMGEGNLLEALLKYGLDKGYKIAELPIDKLYGVELNSGYYFQFFEKIKQQYGVELPKDNFTNEDIFFLEKNTQFDIIFGNPPWQNFNDLPQEYKATVKPAFFKYDLVGNARDLLLGGSRIDIAALVIQKAMEKNLKPGGEAIFFMPLSLLLNDGANRHFRTYKINKVPYSVERVYDFNNAGVFDGISTRYGLVYFLRDKIQDFPIDFLRWENGSWKGFLAKPLFHETDPLSIFKESDENWFDDFEPIFLKKESTPRQGLNTCGANDAFFFDECEALDDDYCVVYKGDIKTVLPQKYICPLITSKNFKDMGDAPNKWVLLPYNSNGKPMEWPQIENDEFLMAYLLSKRNLLTVRKGLMINTWLKRGYWWALLGVGNYNFFPWKIVWEAYGKTCFEPKIFPGHWQANQSLQAFIPLKTRQQAEVVLESLQDEKIEEYLLSLKMEGTMNWAQPGKIRKLIKYSEDAPTLFVV